jgi:serine/threonine protein kinase
MTAQALQIIINLSQMFSMCVFILLPRIHITSHNVLITDDRRAVLTDFGLSRTASTISTMTNSKSSYSGGTLAWTAPEIFNETAAVSNFTAKSDVYSYGILIYEVLSGAYGGSMPW